MTYLDVFKMPKAVTITARTSSITNSFVNGIIPCIMPTEEEVKQVLDVLEMDCEHVNCAYCGDKYTEWDHFRPLVIGKQPTGYITEINNLVPACGKCNQSKGNKNWEEWIYSDAPLSPKSRKVPHLDKRVARLQMLEKTSIPIKMDFEKIVGKELWDKHWCNCEQLHNQMHESQKVSDEIRFLLKDSLKKSKKQGKHEAPIEKSSIKNSGLFQEIKSFLLNGKNDDNFNKCENIISAKKHDDTYEKKQNEITLENKKVGIIVQTEFVKLLESNKLSIREIEFLQDLDYCKSVFDINFPVLLFVNDEKEISKQRKDHFGRDRYYASAITIRGNKYLLTSQWYDRNKDKLINYLSKYLCKEY